MIPSITLEQIYKDTFRRSTLIAIPQMSSLLEVPGSEFSKYEIFTQIVKDALYKFEYYYPYVCVQKIFIEVDSNSRIGKYYPNFDAYLNNAIDESDITLEIMSCQGLGFNGYLNSQYPLRNFRFENGQFYDFWYNTQTYWGNCICRRPLHEDYIRIESNGENSHKWSDKSRIYYMSEGQDNTYTIFRDQVYLDVCRYIMNIKKNFNLQNMPVELFQGLEEDFNRVDSQLQNTYNSALKASFWLN